MGGKEGEKLPQTSFRKVDKDLSTQPIGVYDQQARSYGCKQLSNHRTRAYH